MLDEQQVRSGRCENMCQVNRCQVNRCQVNRCEVNKQSVCQQVGSGGSLPWKSQVDTVSATQGIIGWQWHLMPLTSDALVARLADHPGAAGE